jgi:hypothetical protein
MCYALPLLVLAFADLYRRRFVIASWEGADYLWVAAPLLLYDFVLARSRGAGAAVL